MECLARSQILAGNSSNPLLSQVYRNRNIEQIFTILDLAKALVSESQISMLSASKKGMAAVQTAVASHKSFTSDEIKKYGEIRRILLSAMEAYFMDRNRKDASNYASEPWNNLKRFGKHLKSGDVVITFNYDSTVERVLLDQQKWSPGDGYGVDRVFQQNGYDQTRVDFPPSMVKVLHLHGAIGWYSKPAFSPDFDLSVEGGGFIPRDVLSATPLETEIAIDPLLLEGLGIFAADAPMPQRPPNDYQILLHPSFLKEYGGGDSHNSIFNRRGEWLQTH